MSGISLEKIITDAHRSLTYGMRVAMPGRVMSFDVATFTAQIQPLIQDHTEGEDGEVEAIAIAPINDVPVMFVGSGGARIRWPVSPGDEVLLVFCSSSIARWKVRGGEVDPGDMRRHHVADAVAIPCLLAPGVAGDATPMIEFTAGGQIHAGGSAKLALASDVAALANWVDSLPVGGTGSTPAPGAPSGVGTSILKGG